MGFLEKVFGRGKRKSEAPKLSEMGSPMLKCPSCLKNTEVKPLPLFCDACGAEVPPLYAMDYSRHPVLSCQVFGRSQHGKTVYLYALTMMLKQLQRIWQNSNENGYSFTPINEESRLRAREIDSFLFEEKMPAGTALGVNDVYVALLQDMVRWGQRTLSIRDTAGEVFERLTIDTDAAGFLLSASGVLMVLSLESFKQGALDSIEDPLNSYIHTLVRNGLSPAGRRVVVVLTKADMHMANLSEPLRKYLQSDPLALLSDLGTPESRPMLPPFDAAGVFHYLEGMRLSDIEIRSWLAVRGYGNALDVLARRHGIELRYTLVSATGGPIGANDFPDYWSPKRVLDPFFWFLELDR